MNEKGCKHAEVEKGQHDLVAIRSSSTRQSPLPDWGSVGIQSTENGESAWRGVPRGSLSYLVAFSSSSSHVLTWRTFRRKVEAVVLMSPLRSRRAAPTPTSVSTKFEMAMGKKRGRGDDSRFKVGCPTLNCDRGLLLSYLCYPRTYCPPLQQLRASACMRRQAQRWGSRGGQGRQTRWREPSIPSTVSSPAPSGMSLTEGWTSSHSRYTHLP